MSQDRHSRGRGTERRPANRFHLASTVPLDDGWGSLADDDRPAPATRVTAERARAIITRNRSPDVPFDASINPYKGCEHGCIYCFARPSHAYLDLSPGLDFETRLFAKPEAASLLRRELRKPRYRVEPIALGVNTDAYQPVERELGITRQLLEVMLEFRHPVSVVTKSNLILRDLELLGELAGLGLVNVMLSITTLDRDLARRMEPRAPTPERRLDAARHLAAAGVPVGVLASPMIPAINDHELEAILAAAAAAGATAAAGYILVRLPHEIKELFEDWLDRHFPLRKQRVLDLIRQTRGGKLYDSDFAQRMAGTGPYAELLRRRFEVACARLGFGEEPPPLDCSRFRVPAGRGDQLRLF